jgi:hypothetical protein
MGVKAIFYVDEVAQTASGAGKMRLRAAAKGDYAAWSHYTPSGTIEITCLNASATEWFRERVGKDVALTFADPTEADLLVS